MAKKKAAAKKKAVKKPENKMVEEPVVDKQVFDAEVKMASVYVKGNAATIVYVGKDGSRFEQKAATSGDSVGLSITCE